MKKFALFLLGALSLIVLLSHVGPMIGLVISLAVLYFAFKKFSRAESAGGKILWGAIGIIALCFSIGNVPAIIGIAALAGLYFVYKTWNSDKRTAYEPNDPFDHFEKEWKEFRYK
ncbi:flagellar basal body rod protein [Sporolactobacillus sp. CPB3-1]|uniref:Flagellar basal body rod protein n=1 Tax=Sporolactobacillus mangiferae TaxID=2940498 RepID=A0ABT0MB00_9BACL|nr:flagellar basal body rod protein [Sporolactobacillus mangiferae]MCL1632030.1 flagellar basal body rod protein [Sporolactobacillus mangiferae]